jgi:hypothetical protein
VIDPNSPQWGRPAHRKRTSAPSIWPPIAEYALDSYQVKVLPLALNQPFWRVSSGRHAAFQAAGAIAAGGRQ